jgi:LysM repeat protein
MPPSALVPSVGVPPPVSLDTGPMSLSGGKIEYVKPAEGGIVTTAAGTSRPATTSYDVDIYEAKIGDSWEAISREYYSDPKYAAVLQAYNRNAALQTGRKLDVPPLHVLRRMMPAAGTPASRSGVPPVGDPWNAVAAVNGPKTYRVPNGDGMSLPAVAKLLLGNDQRWKELYDLNPDVNPSRVAGGTELKVPADARVQ